MNEKKTPKCWIRLTPKGRAAIARPIPSTGTWTLRTTPDINEEEFRNAYIMPPADEDEVQEAIDQRIQSDPGPRITMIDSLDQLPTHSPCRTSAPTPPPAATTRPPLLTLIIIILACAFFTSFIVILGKVLDTPVSLVPECHSPWVIMSPGMPTAHEARVNLDQHGAWIVLAPDWLVIWDAPGEAVAAHGLDAWDASVTLGISQDPTICGFINVIMGDRLIIPDDSQLAEW